MILSFAFREHSFSTLEHLPFLTLMSLFPFVNESFVECALISVLCDSIAREMQGS